MLSLARQSSFVDGWAGSFEALTFAGTELSPPPPGCARRVNCGFWKTVSNHLWKDTRPVIKEQGDGGGEERQL